MSPHNLLSSIKTADEFLQHRELLERFLRIIDIHNIKPHHTYVTSTEECDDELVQLLINLQIVKYDWDELRKQTHRAIGHRIIEFKFSGDKVIELYNRISGKNSRIKKQALELISKDIGERFTFNEMVGIFADLGVPESMFISDTKWRAIFYVLSYYTTSSSNENYLMVLKIIQEVTHPLMFGGNEEEAKGVRKKYNDWLKYSHIDVNADGKVYIVPTKEEWDLGITDLVSADGDIVGMENFIFCPDCIAELWVLWSQVIVLMQAYQSNPSLDRKTLEKLYLEVIGKTEDLIKQEGSGDLSKTYRRPFTSLSTAEVETHAKGAGNPSSLISAILLEITTMNPQPRKIAKMMEQNSELIERVTSATRIIHNEKIKLLEENESTRKATPIQISGKIEVDGLLDGLKSIAQSKKEDNKSSTENLKKIKLSSPQVSFNDNRAKIIVGKKECQLPPFKNEHFFCRAAFKHPTDEFVDWSIIFENMDKTLNSVTKKDSEKDKRMVQDTMYAINKRIKEVVGTDDDLFTWKEKSVRRNY